MNSKAFRRNTPKPRSASSTFISLHFNKSDEDQLEISYKNETEGTTNKEAAEVSQSSFYVAKSADKLPSPEDNINKSPISVVDSVIKDIKSKLADCDLKEPLKNKCSKQIESSLRLTETKSDSLRTEKNKDFQVNATESELKLSPAIEAAEVGDSDSFNHYISDELEKAKCEILDYRDKTPFSFPSQPQAKKKPALTDLKTDDVVGSSGNQCNTNADCSKESSKDQCLGVYNILQNCLVLVKYARNSVRIHILVAALACICAPIPSWLSGFLVGTILSCSLVYWLYKPSKIKRNIYDFNIGISQIFQEEAGILGGWMNELPSFISYSPEQYHVSCTRSVYVRLEGSYLRLSFPQKKIPKRAMFNEPRHEMQFVCQQHYDVTGATVELLPQGLNNKRLWSKKYPICLRIPNSKETVLSKSLQQGLSAAKTNKKEKSNIARINENNEIVIYLFSRTDRDKSLWFSRFLKATKVKIEQSRSSTFCSRIPDNERMDFSSLQNSLSAADDEVDDDFVKLSLSKEQKFEMYMSALLAPLHAEHSFAIKKEKKDSASKREVKTQSTLTWLNVLIGRLFFDFLIEDVWAQLVTAKIKKKLNRIKLPFFLTELIVRDINLGSALPKVHSVSDPFLDERGVWFDMDVSYNGSFHMTLETKLNLDRFKADSEEPTNNSDEDSLESSSDEDYLYTETSEEGSLPVSSGSTSKKLLKLMDKVAQSSYFQHAAKNKFVKKAMNDISNTPLILTVQVQWLTGTLALNIPPWPTDRLWYGFRNNPSLCITARPKLGQHAVTFTHVTEWIEKKLTSEFQKVLVMPNMDDLIIPIMQNGAGIEILSLVTKDFLIKK